MTASTATIADFLLARIGEDEASALDCPKPHGGPHKSQLIVQFDDGYVEPEVIVIDPARVLAECAAKRAIVDSHPIVTGPRILAVDSTGTDFGCETCHCIDKVSADGIVEALGCCDTLRALASVYADHPDYRSEWAS